MRKVRIIAAALGVAVSLCCLCVPAFADGESWETVDTGTRPHTEAVETEKPAELAATMCIRDRPARRGYQGGTSEAGARGGRRDGQL